MIQRIRKAFDVLNSFVHLIRIREVTSMDLNCGNSIITKQMMRCELLQGRKTDIWDRWENDLEYRKSPKASGWNCLIPMLFCIHDDRTVMCS